MNGCLILPLLLPVYLVLKPILPRRTMDKVLDYLDLALDNPWKAGELQASRVAERERKRRQQREYRRRKLKKRKR